MFPHKRRNLPISSNTEQFILICFSWSCFVVAMVFYGLIKDRYRKVVMKNQRKGGREREKTESLSEGRER